MKFEKELSGGHPNSLGNTPQIAEQIVASPRLLPALFRCYDSADEIVRLRVSNAHKRIFRARPELFTAEVADKFIALMGRLKQPSAQWTFCDLCRENADKLSPAQQKRAQKIIIGLLRKSSDWIVLKSAMKTLAPQAKTNARLRADILPRLKELSRDSRKIVAKTAADSVKKLGG